MSTKFIPTESKQYPGYYEILGFSKYLISKDGKVINKKSGRVLSTYINFYGYPCCTIISDLSKVSSPERIHRLVAFAFLGPAPIYENDRTTVNHIDGIKTNNHYTNLEWLSNSANIAHAWKTGLCDNITTAVYVRNEFTNEETRYDSFASCAGTLNIDPTTVGQRLEDGPDRVWPGYLRFRRDGEIFTELSKVDVEKSLNSYHVTGKVVVYLLDLQNDFEKRFDTIEDCAVYLGCFTGTLKQRLSYGPNKVWPGYLRFRRKNETFEYLSEEEIKKSLETYGGSFEVPVYLLDVKTGIETRFDTQADCAKHLGCATSGIHARIKDGPDRVWPGYYRFRKEGDTFKVMTDQEVEDSLNEYSDPTSRPVLVKWYATGTVEEFPSPKTAATRLNSSRTAVTRYASEKEQSLYWNKESPFQIQYKNLLTQWRPLGDLYDELEKTRRLQQIVVTDENWNFIHICSDSLACSKEHDVKSSTMLNIVNTNGERVYSGKRFMRELYYYRHFGKPDWLIV